MRQFNFLLPLSPLLLSIASLLLLSSCSEDKKDIAGGTYFGGEIVNPKTHKVTLFKDNVLIDSVALDANNRFLYQFGEDFEPGLYRFSHGENQIAFLEKGDSLLFRVNTMQFDESISYSGYGSEKNNLMIDLFLMYESENENLRDYYQQGPLEFEQTLDSLKRVRMAKWERFTERNNPSPAFAKVANAAMVYDNFERKESYPFSHYGKDKIGFIRSLPDDFYSYRSKVDINDEDLYTSYSTQRFLNRYFDHLAFLRYGDTAPYNSNSYIHNAHEMEIIDSLVTAPLIKDRLLSRATRIVMANNNNSEEVDQIYALFTQYAVNEKLRADMKRRYDNYNVTAAGKPIPDQLLIDAEGRINTLTSNINATTVLYFWSYDNQQHMDDSHRKIAELRSKYPEIDFIGINTDDDFERWKKVVEQHHFPASKEFQFKETRKALRALSIYVPHKIIILDKNAHILNSHANLYNVHFESDLLAYLNM